MVIFLSAIRNPQSEIDVAGSATWQLVFVCIALFLVLVEVIRGWRLGVMRQLMRMGAIAAGYIAAYFGGGLLVPWLRPSLQIPDIVISALGSAILAVVVYGVVAGLGTLLFKRTAQQKSKTGRLAYGLTGALLGLGFGVFFVWLILTGIRAVGTIAQAQTEARAKAEKEGNLSQSAPEPPEPSVANLNPDSLTKVFARLKNSVELGWVGDFVKKTDVLPTGPYRILTEAGTVLSNPDTAQRFFNSPGVRELSENPKIIALRNDPEVHAMIAQGRVIELMRHPRVVEAMNDPVLGEQMKHFDLKTALEYAKKEN